MMDNESGLASTLDLCGDNQTLVDTSDGVASGGRSQWRDGVWYGARMYSAASACVSSEGRAIKRKARAHRERLGCMLGDGALQGSVLLLTLTVSDDVLGSTRYRERVNARLTALGARFRRLGYGVRITARERGSRVGRPHHHVVLDLGAGGLDGLLCQASAWRGFVGFRRAWVPDERAVMPLWTYERWRHSDQVKRRKGRTYDELMLSRYLAEHWGLGYVDAQVVSAGAGVGYVMTYVTKQTKADRGTPRGGVRVSYSRVASWRWRYGAKPVVYAFKGGRKWYGVRPLALRLAMVAAAEARDFGKVVTMAADWVRERLVRRETLARTRPGCDLFCDFLAVLHHMERAAADAWAAFWRSNSAMRAAAV